jgi:hypothetical protein
MMRSAQWLALVLSIGVIQGISAKAVWGQTPPAAPAAPAEDDDAALVPAEPDFALINLPTTLRLPKFRGNFRLTHRFRGNLKGESFGDQASNLFGLDNGAAIGFEFRFAVARHVQAAIYRTNIDKTLQFYGKYDPIAQSAKMPVSLSALVSTEGRDNFQEDRSPALGGVVSRRIGNVAALYAVPMWVHNSAAVSGTVRDTGMFGLGGRVQVRPGFYVLGEASPRFAGYEPGQTEYGFGIEGRVGGHVFQLNVSNALGTSFGQIAGGGFANSLYLGFNLARKFY